MAEEKKRPEVIMNSVSSLAQWQVVQIDRHLLVFLLAVYPERS